jgi:hypothetical protein
MVKISSLLVAAIILLICCFPYVDRGNTIYIKPILAVLLVALILALLFLALYRSLELKLRERIQRELYDKYGSGLDVQIVPASIINSMNIYNAIATKNYWMYRALGIIGLASSLFLAVAIGQENIIPVYATKVLAFVSSLATGIIFSFNLVEKSNRARKAFRHILNAVMLYKHGQMTMADLLKNYNEAENYLGDDEFRQTATAGASGR